MPLSNIKRDVIYERLAGIPLREGLRLAFLACQGNSFRDSAVKVYARVRFFRVHPLLEDNLGKRRDGVSRWTSFGWVEGEERSCVACPVSRRGIARDISPLPPLPPLHSIPLYPGAKRLSSHKWPSPRPGRSANTKSTPPAVPIIPLLSSPSPFFPSSPDRQPPSPLPLCILQPRNATSTQMER